MRRVRTVLVHINCLKRAVDAAAYFLRLDSQVFRAEGHVLLDNACNKLVVGVLQHQPNLPADIVFFIVFERIHPVHVHLPAHGQEHGVELLCHCRFAGAVMPEQRDKLALPDLHGNAL